MASLHSRCGHYIFALWLLSFYLFSSPTLSGQRLVVYHTSTHDVALVRIYNAGLKCAARGSLKIQDTKIAPKIAICAPSHNFVGLYTQLRHASTIGKNWLNSNISSRCAHNMVKTSAH